MSLLKLPVNSPDLNIIENYWACVKYALAGQTFTDPNSHWTAIQTAYAKAHADQYTTLVGSMPQRLQAVIAAAGGNTKY